MVFLIVHHYKLLVHKQYFEAAYTLLGTMFTEALSAFGNYLWIPLLMQKRRSGEVLGNLFGRTLIS